MFIRIPTFAILLAISVLSGCSDPKTQLIGEAASPDNKRTFALYEVVRGSIMSEYLSLNVAAPDAPYSPGDSVASFHKATDLRAYWTADGRPVLDVRSMDGGISDDVTEMIVCVGTQTGCSSLKPRGRQIVVKNYKAGEVQPR